MLESDRPINAAIAPERRLRRAKAHALDAGGKMNTSRRQRREHHNVEHRGARDLLVETAGRREIGDHAGDRQTARHVIVDAQHIVAQSGVDPDLRDGRIGACRPAIV